MTLRRGLYRSALLAATCTILSTAQYAAADYPIMSHRYLADPGSLVYDGRVYLYNSNDDDNNGGYQMHSVVCISTADMKNWTDHGIVFQVPANATWANNSWAPQAIARDGTIFLYFGNSGSGVGVASSNSPTGGFKDAKGSYLVNGSTPGAAGTDSWLFDPGALIDDDGQAYLSFGGNGVNNGRIIKLGTNLTSTSGSAAAVSTTGFFEASFLFKRNNKYYFAYSTNSANGLRIDYHWSDSPMTGYTYGGIIAGQPPSNNNNNHASQFSFKNQWYHAYHNRVVANQAGIDATYKRNLGLEVLDFNADGSIKQVTYTTDGVPQIGNLDPYVRVEAETMNAQSGIETEPCSAGGMDVTQITSGDWIRLRGVDFGSVGATSFTARVASATTGGSIELRLGSTTGTLIGTCSVPSTGGTQTWSNTTCNVSGATGVKDLYLKFTGSSTFNIDSWQFATAGGGGTAGTGGVSSAGGASVTGGVQGTAGGGTTGTGVSSAGGAPHTAGTSSTGGASAITTGTRTVTGGGSSIQGGGNAGGSASIGGAQTGGGSGSAVLGTAGTSNAFGTGGRSSTGGSRFASGGAVPATGGAATFGGSSAATGGASPATGGSVTTGGFSSSLPKVTTGGSSATTNSQQGANASGCSCRVAERHSNSRSLLIFGLLGLSGIRALRRTRRRRRCGQ